jgi:DNA polymerase-1
MLLLVDAPSCANWCHYAVSPRLGAKGRFRSAAHRLIALVLKLIKTEKPERVGVLFEGKLKAGSTQMPAELAKELPLIRRLLTVGGIPVLEFTDCAVANLALPLLEQAKRRGMPVLLVTTRSVFLQWVGPHVTLLNPAREKLRFDPEQVLKVFGVSPEKIPDRLALVGDEAEGIAGVKGVGPKRAAKLLTQYGSLEKILGALEELPPALAKALGEAGERIRQGRDRAIVREPSPVGRDLLDRLVLSQTEPEQVTRQFTEAGFSDLLGGLLVHAHLQTTSYRTVLTAEELKETAQALSSMSAFAIDTETTGLDVRRAGLVGISLAVGPGKALYLPVATSAS